MNPLRSGPTLSLVLVLAVAGCGRGEQRPAGRSEPARAIAAGADPESLFTALETRLLAARSIEVDYAITSVGSVPSSVRGRLALAEGNRAVMSPAGTFLETPVDLGLVSDGSRMRIRTDTTLVETATPPALNEALVIGLTRMGHLHNIAVLAGGLPPDHSGGGAADWVRAGNFAGEDSVASPDPDWVTVAFDIFIGERQVAHATLWLDPATGLPAARAQTVQFPSGAMRADERYLRFSLNGEPPGVPFALEP